MTAEIIESRNDGDTVSTTFRDRNDGGRIIIDKDTEVRILEIDGSISKLTYLVEIERSDRNGLMVLKEKATNKIARVHYRRVMRNDIDGKAIVIESSGRFWALCPATGHIMSVLSSDTNVTCDNCKSVFELYWLGVKPMVDTHMEETSVGTMDKPMKQDKPIKSVKIEPKPVDVDYISKIKDCELWVKKNVNFDHAKIDVRAYTLIYIGDGPRKMSFNTYNDTLGKKGGELPLDAFLSDTKSGSDTRKNQWCEVKDLEKLRNLLTKDGYVKL